MKKYGQHFLVNARIIDGIIQAVPAGVADVLEIGPGRGALTEKLLEKNFPCFTAVEIDSEMESYLQAHFPQLAGRLVRADFMRFDLQQVPARPTWVVSNLPYIDAADILDKVLSWEHFAGAVCLLA